MIQGGRLSVRTGKVFQALGIQPIISIDDQGAGTAFGMHARFAASLRHLERIVKREAKAGRLRVQVSHVDSRQAAVDFAEKLSKIPQVVCEGVTEISPIVTASAGSGAIAVAFMKEGEK
jgi:fatty acid-binding protein DegV